MAYPKAAQPAGLPPEAGAEVAGVGPALARLADVIDQLSALPSWQLHEPDLAAVLIAVEIAERRLSAVGLATLDEVERRGAPDLDPASPGPAPRASDTAAWLRGLLALSPTDARRRVALARWLPGEGAPAGTALARGQISAEQAQIIHRTMTCLADAVDPATRAESLTFLLSHAGVPDQPTDPEPTHPEPTSTEATANDTASATPTDSDAGIDMEAEADADAHADTHADTHAEQPGEQPGEPPRPLRGFDPLMLARLANRLRQRLDPDAGERLACEQDRWEDQNTFNVGLDRQGRGHLSGVLDPVATEQLLAALDPLSSPRPATAEGGYDTRSPGQRRAEALMVIVNTVLGLPQGTDGALPSQAGARPRMLVLVPYCTLAATLTHTAGTPPATTGHGHVLSARTAQQLSCTAEIVPVLLDPDGCPLDVGQSVYAFPDRIRRAIEARDHGCTFPGCTAPAPWCHTHHLVAYSRGGNTSVSNGTLLCGRHHRQVHAHGWTGMLEAGRVTWHPPHRRPGQADADPETLSGLTNPDHEPLPAVQHALEELTRRWLTRNPHLTGADEGAATRPHSRAS